jgi:hypothetical protein
MDLSDRYTAATEEAQSSSEGMAELTRLVNEARQIEDIVANLEAELKDARKVLLGITTQKIPELMSEMGVSSLETADGTKVKMTDFISGSLPKEPYERQRAINWLVDHGGDGLIKSEVKVNFARREHNLAVSLMERLKKGGMDAELQTGVHASTLKAFVRERLQNGDEIDLATLGVYVGQVAKIG